MLLQIVLSVLCQLGFHSWRPDSHQENVQHCSRCDAVRVNLQQGKKVRFDDVEITIKGALK